MTDHNNNNFDDDDDRDHSKTLIGVIVIAALIFVAWDLFFVKHALPPELKQDDYVIAEHPRPYRKADGTMMKAKPVVIGSKQHISQPSWRGNAYIEKNSEGQQKLVLEARDVRNRPVRVDSFEIEMIYPENEVFNFIPLLKKDGLGRYIAMLDDPRPGNWKIHGKLKRDNQVINVQRRVRIR